ncbi:phage tail assembly protein, partial [Salmonella enterica subsp. enterica serovar Infantis]|nr:phage tail assembly protein [Salmonella enterica subsp. enterica serovar Infantis]
AQSEVDALIKVLPRMTYPALTAQELTAMNLPDMLSLAAKVIGFLSPASAE